MNEHFLQVLTKAFEEYLHTGARSNKKLKILHGAIANDLLKLLGKDYEINSLGFNNDKEATINGRYIDKKVDITIYKKEKIVAGIGVKFVMSNYAQNSNNYFENMLGETANIRTANTAYFQILILPFGVPYFTADKKIAHVEKLSLQHLKKYSVLSTDDTAHYFHTPNKTLLCMIDFPPCDNIKTKSEYIAFCGKFIKNNSLHFSSALQPEFSDTIILNDYAMFIEKIYHFIKSI